MGTQQRRLHTATSVVFFVYNHRGKIKGVFMKIISRISEKGNRYYQTALNKEGEETKFVPVFVKKSLNGEFEKISTEKKVDKRGLVFEVIEINDKNVFMPKVEEGQEPHFVITK